MKRPLDELQSKRLLMSNAGQTCSTNARISRERRLWTSNAFSDKRNCIFSIGNGVMQERAN